MEIITQEEAKKIGLSKYFTGKPCKNGHVSERTTANKNCVECRRLKSIEYRAISSEYSKKYRKTNLDDLRKKRKKYYENNKERILKQQGEYNKKNREIVMKSQNEWRKKNRQTVKGKLELFLRETVRRMVDGIKIDKNINSLAAINYSSEELKIHIESCFKDGMSWDNHGEWHIDHIIPLSYLVEKHKDKSQEEILNIVNSLDNLQPLWASENQKKGAKLCR